MRISDWSSSVCSSDLKLTADKRIVRNPQKIRSVRDNAQFVMDLAPEPGSFGKLLATWPADDQIGLLDLLAKPGSRLGGTTGPYLNRTEGRTVGKEWVNSCRCRWSAVI